MDEKLKGELGFVLNYFGLDGYPVESFNSCRIWDLSEFIRDLPCSASDRLIREFKDKVNWSDISRKRVLTEDFIREFQDYLDWDMISYYQKLSHSFIREFSEKINLPHILNHRKISNKLRRELEKELDNSRFDILDFSPIDQEE